MTVFCPAVSSFFQRKKFDLVSNEVQIEKDGKVYRVLTYVKKTERNSQIASAAARELSSGGQDPSDSASARTTIISRKITRFNKLKSICSTIQRDAESKLPAEVYALLEQEPSLENIDRIDRELRRRDIALFWTEIGIAISKCVNCDEDLPNLDADTINQKFEEWCEKWSEELKEVTELSLDRLRMTHIPPQIDQLPGLRTLSFKETFIKSIPDELKHKGLKFDFDNKTVYIGEIGEDL